MTAGFKPLFLAYLSARHIALQDIAITYYGTYVDVKSATENFKDLLIRPSKKTLLTLSALLCDNCFVALGMWAVAGYIPVVGSDEYDRAFATLYQSPDTWADIKKVNEVLDSVGARTITMRPQHYR